MNYFSTKLFGIRLSCRVYNLLYTDGWKTGLTVKSISVMLIRKNMYTLHIPLFPMSYNRTNGLYIRAAQKKIRSFIEEKEKEEPSVWM